MTDAPPLPSDPPAEPRPPAPARSRAARALAVLVVEVVGCSVHALLYPLAHAGWLALDGPLGAPGWSLAVLTSASVVLALSALCPGLPWWGLALVTAAGDGRRASAWETTLGLGQRLSSDRRARTDAFRAALAMHAVLAAPALGVALALELGGWAWAALALLVLISPSLTLAAFRQAMRGYPGVELAGAERTAETTRGVVRVLAGLTLTTTALGLGAALLVAVPAPTRLAGTCEGGARSTPVSLPGALPGTGLFVEASASHVTLSASDGGGPGSIPLVTCQVLRCGGAPARAIVDDRGGAQVVTLCPAAQRAGDAHAQQVVLSPRGYRLDDGIAGRVLRSPVSTGLALVLLLLAFAYSRWGFRALLRWWSDVGAPSQHARTTVLWALALGGVQLAWLLVTWLGP